MTRERSVLTIGAIRIEATGCNLRRGWITVGGTVNPTRTLSSLLRRFGERSDFTSHIAGLDALSFFHAAPPIQRMSLALDGRDNYLPSSHPARLLLAPDAFATFMPIYVAKLRAMIARAIGAFPHEASEDGTDQFFNGPRGQIRLSWGSIEVPQAETYFERYHSRAVAAVRTAGTSILDGDRRPLLRLYPNDPDMDREADCYRIGLKINERYRLVVYAKTADRIRFEVRRHGRGRYDGVGAGSSPDDRLLGILMQVERCEATVLPNWLEIFRRFDEPDAPAIGDLIELIAAVVRAAGSDESAIRTLFDRLIVDGGFTPDDTPEVTSLTVNALRDAGVIVSMNLRNGRLGVGHHRRYSLAQDYTWLRHRLLVGLAEPPDDPSSFE